MTKAITPVQKQSTTVSPVTAPGSGVPGTAGLGIPDYLSKTYHWAYLDRRSLPLLDRQLVVNAILWGNAARLMEAAIKETHPGERVLQPACVYGGFSRMLADRIGPGGQLDVRDIAPIQVEFTQEKLRNYRNVTVSQADAAVAPGVAYDTVQCFFLLHEVPDSYKQAIVRALLECVKPGGRVVFVDYHKPAKFHPMRVPMTLVFRYLEPFADALCATEITDLAGDAGDRFHWSKTLFFGGLYQKVVAQATCTEERNRNVG